MPIRKEWTEWHLTPRGWERGSTRVQDAGNTWRQEPADRLLSCVYTEQQVSPEGQVTGWCEFSWRTKDPGKLEQLAKSLQQFGSCPGRLTV